MEVGLHFSGADFPVLIHSTEQPRLGSRQDQGTRNTKRPPKPLKPCPQRSRRADCTCSLICTKKKKVTSGWGKFSCAGAALSPGSRLDPGQVISFPLLSDLTLTSSFLPLFFFLLLLEFRGKCMLISMLNMWFANKIL